MLQKYDVQQIRTQSYHIPNKSKENKILHLLSKSRPTLLFLTGITSTSCTIIRTEFLTL